jgi:hypothetical protein
MNGAAAHPTGGTVPAIEIADQRTDDGRPTRTRAAASARAPSARIDR